MTLSEPFNCCNAFRQRINAKDFRIVGNDMDIVILPLGDYLFRMLYCPFCGKRKTPPPALQIEIAVDAHSD